MKDILRAIVLGGLFIIPFLTLIVTSDAFFPYITGKNFTFRILVELVLSAWLVLALLDAHYRPKFSYILVTLAVFMGVTLISTLLAYHVQTAFWSNYERMEGYITLLHLFAYFLVLSSSLVSQKQWLWFLQTALAVATFVAFRGLGQLASTDNPGLRVDSTLGNSTYMAIYMLFQLFILAYLFLQTRHPLLRFLYSALSILFLFILVQTGTRGTAIGLAVGAVMAVVYISLFGAKEPALRKYAVGAVLLLAILVAGFVGLRNTQLVQNNPNLARIANIDLQKDLAVRSLVWGMAYEGIKDRPIFGWGMGNYNFVFNQQYDPRMYAQEQWFDRVHNIIFDWLVAGGVVGLLAYLAIFGSLIYYLFIRPYFYQDKTFSVAESAVLIGLLAGYFTHNLVVFDNIVSYLFFATIIAYIHWRVAKPILVVERFHLSSIISTQVILPIISLVLVVMVYLINVPAILASRDLILALSTNDLAAQYEYYDKALTRGTFAQQEVVEQLIQQTIKILRTPDTSPDIKSLFITRSEQEIDNVITSKPNDARLHILKASLYRATNDLTKAAEQLNIARELSPNKQWIILQQGVVALGQQNYELARDYFQSAFALDYNFAEAREYYVASLFMTNEPDTAKDLITKAGPAFYDQVAKSDLVVGAANMIDDVDFMLELYERRLELDPTKAVELMKLAVLYYQVKDNQKAIKTINQAITLDPKLKATGLCIISNIETGLDPQTPCS